MGTFEAHLTVETESFERRDAFEALCAELGVKCVLIELAQGVHRAQPMTATHHRGELVDARREIDALRARIETAGFPVVRVKVEMLLGADELPVDDPANDPHGYFEFHAKVRMDRAMNDLVPLCARHGAHLSHNDRKRDPRGIAERFVTLRVYRVDRSCAEAAFDALIADLQSIGFPPIATKREYTVYDGRAELDAGW